MNFSLISGLTPLNLPIEGITGSLAESLTAKCANASGTTVAELHCPPAGAHYIYRMHATTVPSGPRVARPVGKSHHIEIDDEALVINGVRFETSPRPQEITKALGSAPEEFGPQATERIGPPGFGTKLEL